MQMTWLFAYPIIWPLVNHYHRTTVTASMWSELTFLSTQLCFSSQLLGGPCLALPFPFSLDLSFSLTHCQVHGVCFSLSTTGLKLYTWVYTIKFTPEVIVWKSLSTECTSQWKEGCGCCVRGWLVGQGWLNGSAVAMSADSSFNWGQSRKIYDWLLL